MEHRFFRAIPMGNGVTRITDISDVHCYLVEGTKKAILIDALPGLRGLRDFVGTLTSLPVEVAATHGHLDHIGGIFEYGACYLHPADIPLLEQDTAEARKGYVDSQVKNCVYTLEDFTVTCPVDCTPVADGEEIDLGGRRLEVLEVPGHTRGSVCYFDPGSGDFFAGDACNGNTLLLAAYSATVGEYLEALKRLKKRQAEIKTFHLFHAETPVENTVIDDNIGCCEDILNHRDDHIRVEFLNRVGYLAKERAGSRRKDGKFGNIMYSEELAR